MIPMTQTNHQLVPVMVDLSTSKPLSLFLVLREMMMVLTTLLLITKLINLINCISTLVETLTCCHLLVPVVMMFIFMEKVLPIPLKTLSNGLLNSNVNQKSRMGNVVFQMGSQSVMISQNLDHLGML